MAGWNSYYPTLQELLERRQQEKEQSDWDRLRQQASMAQNMDWQTLLGFGLGKILRGQYDKMMDARKREKDNQGVANANGVTGTTGTAGIPYGSPVDLRDGAAYGNYAVPKVPYNWTSPDFLNHPQPPVSEQAPSAPRIAQTNLLDGIGRGGTVQKSPDNLPALQGSIFGSPVDPTFNAYRNLLGNNNILLGRY